MEDSFVLTCRLLAWDIKHPLCRDAQASLTYLLLQVELFFFRCRTEAEDGHADSATHTILSSVRSHV